MDLFYYAKVKDKKSEAIGMGVVERPLKLGLYETERRYLGEIESFGEEMGESVVFLKNGERIYEFAFDRFDVVEPERVAG